MSEMENSEDSLSIRFRNPTERGRMYHLNLLEEQRSSAQRAWRKQINKVTNLIGDSTNIDLLKSERTFLETRMDILYAASNRLCEALADNYEAKRRRWRN